MPAQHTRDGPELSPPLAWSDPPPATAAFALVVEDPDAPDGTWVHWLLWNLPASTREVKQDVPRVRNLPDGSKQGRNDYGELGWGGPAPPPGPAHRYLFTLYALREPLSLPAGAGRRELADAMQGRVLAQTRLVSHYGRRRGS